MAEYKKFGSDPSDLKKADAEKSSSAPQTKPLQESVGRGVHLGFTEVKRGRNEKKMPVAVDVIIAVLMLAIVVGIVGGSYYLFRYFSNDYEGIAVEYTIVKIADTGSLVRYRAMKNQDVYIDSEDDTRYFGHVVSSNIVGIDEENGDSMLVLVIRANAKYKKGEGYSIGERRLAVGSEYTLRTKQLVVDGTMVEMQIKEGGGQNADQSAPAKNESGGDAS